VIVRGVAMLAVAATVLAAAGPASAEPDPATPDAATPAVADAAAPPVDDGKVASTPPATTKSPDGWTLKISPRTRRRCRRRR
jgi:hypothetical protein